MRLLQWLKHTITRVLLLCVVAPLCRMSRRQVVHFLHVGKTGGTAVKAAFSAYPFFVRFHRGAVLLFHNHSVGLTHVRDSDRFVAFFRDPASRFVSGFNSRLRKGRPRRFVPWSRRERRAFARFPSAESLAAGLSDPAEPTRRAARQAMNSIEHVRSFQSDWVRGCAGLSRRQAGVLLLGRQETLTRDFERLRELLELGPDVRLPESPRAAHRSPAHASGELSAEARENLRRWYDKDYELLSCITRHGYEEQR